MNTEEELKSLNVGDTLRLTSIDGSTAFAGPFKTTVLQMIVIEGGRSGCVVQIDPPAYFGPDPLHMHESRKFILMPRAAAYKEILVSKSQSCSVHVIEPSDWSCVDENPVPVSALSTVAWCELSESSEIPS